MEASTDIHFYEIVAQVLPILILIMAVEDSRLKGSGQTLAGVVYCLANVLILVVAEIAALAVIANGYSTPLTALLTRVALALGIAYVFVAFSDRLIEEATESREGVKNRYIAAYVLVYSVVFGFGLAALDPPS